MHTKLLLCFTGSKQTNESFQMWFWILYWLLGRNLKVYSYLMQTSFFIIEWICVWSNYAKKDWLGNCVWIILAFKVHCMILCRKSWPQSFCEWYCYQGCGTCFESGTWSKWWVFFSELSCLYSCSFFQSSYSNDIIWKPLVLFSFYHKNTLLNYTG